MAADFTWADIVNGTPTDPDPINAMGHQVEDLSNRNSQYAYSFSASAAVGTSPTGILTITGCTLKSGRAYSVENIGGVFSSVSNFADFQLWTPNTAGTQIGAFYRTPCFAAPQMNCYGKIYLKRTAATDFNADVVLAVVASTGTVTHDASANRPRAFVVTDIGPASKYPFAFDVA